MIRMFIVGYCYEVMRESSTLRAKGSQSGWAETDAELFRLS
jgi:hypothetical protein